MLTLFLGSHDGYSGPQEMRNFGTKLNTSAEISVFCFADYSNGLDGDQMF